MITDARTAMEEIETAAFELLEESLAGEYRRRLRKRLGEGESAERAVAEYVTERTQAEGVYEWAGHLFLLERLRNQGALNGAETQAVELRGLGAIERARARFREAHPPCGHCDTPLFERQAASCAICGGDLKAKVA